MSVVQQIAQAENAFEAPQTGHIAKYGREIPIDDNGAPIRRDGGAVQGVVLVFRDFTEQKRAEKIDWRGWRPSSSLPTTQSCPRTSTASFRPGTRGRAPLWLPGGGGHWPTDHATTAAGADSRGRANPGAVVSGQRVEHLETVRVTKDGKRIDVL